MSEAAAVRPRRWPWLGVVLFVALAGTGSVLVLANGTGLLDDAAFILVFGMFGVVGALIMSRVPGNRIGALLLYGSGVTALSFVCGELTTYLVRDGVTDGSAVVAAAIVSNIGWLFGIIPVIFLIPLLFPDGHLPSPRWVPVPVAFLASLGLMALVFLLGEPALTDFGARIENPLFVEAFADLQIPDAVFSGWLIVAPLVSIAGVVIRFRRSRGVERQQIKWVALAFVFMAVSLTTSEILFALGVESGWVDVGLSAPAFLAIPVSIGIAVLQFHLYELDVVVKKALVAGVLVVLVVAVYAAVVGLFGVVASGRESSVSLFVIALLLGLAFRPVSGFARRIADRVVYGGRATPYEVLTEFSERVGESYATEDVLGRMAQIIGQAVGAKTAHVWVRVGNELRPAATWPGDTVVGEPRPLADDALPRLEDGFAVEVRDRGELLGALSVAMPPNDPMDPSKERLVRDLAGQAGLVLRNVRLVEELRASQRRLVRAQDDERRRLERNIHDGAQQQLVALTVKMRLAHSLATKEPEKTAALLEQLQAETQTALVELRDLARGIYPPLLADQGLAAALQAQARKVPVPVQVDPDGVGRYPQDVEAAVYFSVLEALQNVTKYAHAEHVTVTLAQEDADLVFIVADDGRGFDPSASHQGSGLQGMVDRLGALDGRVTVRSAPGEGTVVTGRVPV